MAIAAVAAVSRRSFRRAQSEAVWIDLLKQSAEKFNELSEKWKNLEVDDQMRIDQLEAQLECDEKSFREFLKRCPWGDPSATAFVPQRLSSDALVASHGLATRAIVQCELSHANWELQKASNGEAVSEVVPILSKVAIHHLRLLEIEEAHACLTKAYRLSRDNFDVTLLDFTTKLVAARSFQFPSEAKCPELELVRQRLCEVKYTEAQVLCASGASSVTEFFRSSMAPQFEEHLKTWRQDMAVESSERSQRFVLVDLVLVFLLHKGIPLDRIYTALGGDVVEILFRHHVLHGCRGDRDVLASVALCPVGDGEDREDGDLILATDFESTCFSDDTEPAMYLSQDSLALMTAAPRRSVQRLLDLCCGCGIQGLMALRTYAETAVFVDVNPRCLSFTSFNLSLNGLRDKCEGLLQKDICQDSIESLGTFDAILANPPFMPNPRNIATGASLLFGNGGDDGEDVFSAAVSLASRNMRLHDHSTHSVSHFVAVSKTPNLDDFPVRLRSWWTGACPASAQIFRGPTANAREYMPTAISSGVEPIRYQHALQEQGIHTLSQILLFVSADDRPSSGSASGAVLDISLSGDIHEAFWLNVEALQGIRRQLQKWSSIFASLRSSDDAIW